MLKPDQLVDNIDNIIQSQLNGVGNFNRHHFERSLERNFSNQNIKNIDEKAKTYINTLNNYIESEKTKCKINNHIKKTIKLETRQKKDQINS